MKIRLSLVGLLIMVIASNTAQASNGTCARGEPLRQAAQEAIDEYRDDEGLSLLHKAATSCDRHSDWQHLGEQLIELGEDSDEQAAEAFVRAYDLGATGVEQGNAAAHYAVLLLQSGDPQRALSYIRQARTLDPNNDYTNTWYARISDRVQNLDAQDVVRGLGDMAFKPMVLNQRPADAEFGAANKSGGSGAVVASSRRVEVPLNFETNSTQLDVVTQTNLEVLGSTLAAPQFADFRFEFVGHADLRGEAAQNLKLSSARANVIAQAVLNEHPSLRGRVLPIGRGEKEPVVVGDSEAAHRANRRLEVIAYPKS